jgi:hypothetical protein
MIKNTHKKHFFNVYSTNITPERVRASYYVEVLSDEQIQKVIDHIVANFARFADGDAPRGFVYEDAGSDAAQHFGFTDDELVEDCNQIAEAVGDNVESRVSWSFV